MRYIEAPTECLAGDADSIFLAGGISECRDWQRELAGRSQPTDLDVLNPRRVAFDVAAPKAARQQIEWEFRHLRRATARLFWFLPPTLCPIALFELGAWSRTHEPLFVGVDRDYSRRLDVIEQLRLTRPDVDVVDSIEELARQVVAWQQRGVAA